jgi:hypothetical protein
MDAKCRQVDDYRTSTTIDSMGLCRLGAVINNELIAIRTLQAAQADAFNYLQHLRVTAKTMARVNRPAFTAKH